MKSELQKVIKNLIGQQTGILAGASIGGQTISSSSNVAGKNAL